jgi:hypothetical protein
MEARIINIRTFFKTEYHSFISSFESLNTNEVNKKVLKEPVEENVKKPKAIGQTPIMLKKINRYKEEQKKNNLKRQQKAFEYHGNIDDYQRELEERFFTNEKEIH